MERTSFLCSSAPDELTPCMNSDTPIVNDRCNSFLFRSATSKRDSHSNASSTSSTSRQQFHPKGKLDTFFDYKNAHKDQSIKRRSSFSSYQPRSHFESNTKYQASLHDSNYLALFAASNKVQSQTDTCGPHVHNLQKEMDLLRTEIQRLKTIDINTYSTTKTRHRTINEGHISEKVEECKQWTIATNKSTKKKLGDKRVMHDYEVLNSDESETEQVETDDFKSFVEKLKQERIQSCNQSSGSTSTEALEVCKGESVDSGVQSDEVECEEFKRLKVQIAENQSLLCKQQEDLQYLHNVLQRKDSELRDWVEKWSEQERTRSQAVRRKPTHTVAVQCDESLHRDRIHTGSQCNSTTDTLELQSQVKTSAEERKRLQTIIEELQTRNDSLKEENHILRKTDLVGERLLPNESSEGHSSHFTSIAQQLGEILEDMGLPHATIAEIIQRTSEIKQQWSLAVGVSPSAYSIEDCSLNDRNLQLQEELQQLKSTHQTELQHLNEEKSSLMQKVLIQSSSSIKTAPVFQVLELRKLIKKEAAEKEAAQAASAKHESSIKDQYAEVEQSRVLVQQKKQQVSELEDSLAMLQHENENWERDYSILMRKNERLERDLHLARKLEANFNGVMQNQA